jgi:hypothetical protein
MSPVPHRISLGRGWKTIAGRGERIFHAPTLPSTVSEIRLVVTPQLRESQFQLNGEALAWRNNGSQLDCDITQRLQPVNRLVIENIGSLTSFEIYLEIYEDA